MSRYQTILNLGDELIMLMNKGLISIHILDWKVYYEAYLQQVELQKKNGKIKKEDAVLTVAANYDIARRTMYNVIAFMEGGA